MRPPPGVTTIATIFLLNAASLCAIGIVMLTAPEILSNFRGWRWLGAREIGGPFLPLLLAAVWGLIGWGLIRMRGWARLGAMLLIVPGMSFGIVALVTASHLDWSFFAVALQILASLVVVWYFFTTPIIEQFSKTTKAT